MISYAQNLEDVALNRVFQNRKDGFYIDIGAHHPTDLSVTKYFYDLGWRGINIEPIPESLDLFKQQRPEDINLNIALGREQSSSYIYKYVDRPELSTMDSEVAARIGDQLGGQIEVFSVETRTLSDVCHEFCKNSIDFIKIDVEGYEKEVLLGADWENFRPLILVIEANIPCRTVIDWDNPDKITTYKDWEFFLSDVDYKFAYYDGLNRYYLRREDFHLKNRYSVPISPVQDNYKLYRELELEQLLAEKQKSYSQKSLKLQEEVNDLNIKISKLTEAELNLESKIFVPDTEKGGVDEIKLKLESKIEALESEKKELSLANHHWKNHIDILDQDNKKLRNAVSNLKEDYSFLSDDLELLSNNYWAALEIVRHLENKNYFLDDSVEELKKELSGQRNLTDKISAENLTLKSKLKNEQDKSLYFKSKFEEQFTNYEKLRKEFESIQNNYQELRIKFNQKIKIYRVLHDEVVKLRKIISYNKKHINLLRHVLNNQKNISLSSQLKRKIFNLLISKLNTGITKFRILNKINSKLPKDVQSNNEERALQPDAEVELLNNLPAINKDSQHPIIEIYQGLAIDKISEVANKFGIEFIPALELQFAHEKKPPKKDFIAFSYIPLNLPKRLLQTDEYQHLTMDTYNPGNLNDLKRYCRILFTFTEHHAKQLTDLTGLNVQHVQAPLNESGMHWSLEAYENNDKKQIIQVGWWLLRCHAIFMLPDSTFEKLWINASQFGQNSAFYVDEQYLTNINVYFSFMKDTVAISGNTSDEQLKSILCSNIVFGHFYDAIAPDIISKCIMHNTPILLNAIPPIREYLGNDYPFYYYSYKDAINKASDYSTVLKAHKYLKNLSSKMKSSRCDLAKSIENELST